MSSTIPDWCKRAAEEITDPASEIVDWDCECWHPGVHITLAAIIAKHAEGRVIFYHKFPDKLSLQVDELVEAARELAIDDLLYEDPIVCSPAEAERMKRLRRALEPFNE